LRRTAAGAQISAPSDAPAASPERKPDEAPPAAAPQAPQQAGRPRHRRPKAAPENWRMFFLLMVNIWFTHYCHGVATRRMYAGKTVIMRHVIVLFTAALPWPCFVAGRSLARLLTGRRENGPFRAALMAINADTVWFLAAVSYGCMGLAHMVLWALAFFTLAVDARAPFLLNVSAGLMPAALLYVLTSAASRLWYIYTASDSNWLPVGKQKAN